MCGKKKTVKKVDVKKATKLSASARIESLLLSEGIQVGSGADYGMTEGTLVAHFPECDIQIKFIAPKAGIQRYELLEEEEGEE